MAASGEDKEWERYLFSDVGHHDAYEPHAQSHASSFCTAANVDGCSQYVDQTLTTFGCPPLLVVQCVASKEDAVRILNSTHTLIEFYRDAQRRKQDEDHRLQRAINDLSDCNLKLEQAREELSRVSRALSAVSEEKRQLSVKRAQLEEEAQAVKEELRRVKVVCQQKIEQYNHENKKREREHTKLKERLQKLLSDKSKEQRMGMELVKALQRPDGKRGTWNKGAAEDLQRTLVLHYETLQKQVMKENMELRASLAAIQHELVEVVHHASAGADLNSSLSETYLSASASSAAATAATHEHPYPRPPASPLREAHFDLPYDLGRDYIEESIRGRLAALRGQVTRLKRWASVGDALEPGEGGAADRREHVVGLAASVSAPPGSDLPAQDVELDRLRAKAAALQLSRDRVRAQTEPLPMSSPPRTQASALLSVRTSTPTRSSQGASLLSPARDLFSPTNEDVFS